MRKSTYCFLLFPFCIAFLGLLGCKKLLDEKSDQKLAIPSSLSDFQALMDNWSVLNSTENNSLEVSADDYSLSDSDLAGLTSEQYRRMYSWQKDYLFTPAFNEWSTTYKAVYQCSSVIEGLDNSGLKRDAEFNNVKGQALVFRSKLFLQALAVWAKAYPISSATDLGIPLRPELNFNETSVRATVREGYGKIITDLKNAIPLLPAKPLHPFRPSKAGAYGLLARALLNMGNFEQAGLYADSCISISGTLMDYNKFNSADRYPFALFNTEVIYDIFTPPASPVNSSRARISPELIQSYQANDLRKSLFYMVTNGNYYFKGTYHQPALFFGVATDEMYLIQAECLIRSGKVQMGLSVLDKLLVNRFKTGTYLPKILLGQDDALSLVLSERRKELVMRGLRWMDLKRLNAEGRSIIISRTIKGQPVFLSPNDNRYALPIPEDVIQLTGMPQNER